MSDLVTCPTCGGPVTVEMREIVMLSSDEVTEIKTGIKEPIFTAILAPQPAPDPLREAAQEALDYLDMAADAMPTVLMGARGVRQTLRAALEDKP